MSTVLASYRSTGILIPADGSIASAVPSCVDVGVANVS